VVFYSGKAFPDNIMENNLKNALQNANIKDYLNQFYPKSISQNRVKCVWRGGTHFSGVLYQSKGKTRLRDHVTGEDFDAYDFLIKVMGYSKAQATREIISRYGVFEVSKDVKTHPVLKPPKTPEELRTVIAKLKTSQTHVDEVMRGNQDELIQWFAKALQKALNAAA
jgi:hypothetical protein